MGKILLVLTGGTIGSSTQDHIKSPDAKTALPLLLHSFCHSDSPYCQTEFDVIDLMQELSENFRLEQLNQIRECLCQVDWEEYDGAIVTHGTDTLSFTAAFLSVAMRGLLKPICLVSSRAPLGEARSNGEHNFAAAVAWIKERHLGGIYVPYENSGGRMYVHLGEELFGCDAQDDFYSLTMGQGEQSPWKHLFFPHPLTLEENVLLIAPYVGLDYSAISLEGKRAVLHGTYHSGTACTKGEKTSLLGFLQRAKAAGVMVFLEMGQEKKGLLEGDIYASTKELIEAGAVALYDKTTEMGYMKLLIACAYYQTEEEILAFLAE